MTRPIYVRALARADVTAAVRWYATEAGADTADAFVSAFEASLAAIADQPDSGSPRWAELLGLPGLRSRGTGAFPWLVFYIAAPDRIEIWRVLHTARDIPAAIAADTPPR